jgi:hypothetical protein
MRRKIDMMINVYSSVYLGGRIERTKADLRHCIRDIDPQSSRIGVQSAMPMKGYPFGATRYAASAPARNRPDDPG